MASFDDMMTGMSNEVLALKKEKEKSALNLETVTERVPLEFDLELITSQWGVPQVRSDKMAVVTIGVGSNNPLVGVSYDIEGLESRIIRDVATYEDGEIGRMVYLYSDNSDDMATLEGGGSVHLSYDMVITATTSIDVAVEYKDLWVD